jgi:hypothetical protein
LDRQGRRRLLRRAVVLSVAVASVTTVQVVAQVITDPLGATCIATAGETCTAGTLAVSYAGAAAAPFAVGKSATGWWLGVAYGGNACNDTVPAYPCYPYDETGVAIANGGDAHGMSAVSTTGCADAGGQTSPLGSSYVLQYTRVHLGLSGTGCTYGGDAGVSGTGDAAASWVAVSGTSTAHGALGVGGGGASTSCGGIVPALEIGVLGSATASQDPQSGPCASGAVAGNGSATGSLITVAGTGDANGGLVAVSGGGPGTSATTPSGPTSGSNSIAISPFGNAYAGEVALSVTGTTYACGGPEPISLTTSGRSSGCG